MSLENPGLNIDVYGNLKKEFLSGNIKPEELRDKLKSLDQSTPDRVFSIKNLDFLLDNDVQNFILTFSEDIIKNYYQFLSFTQLHVGQIKAFENKNDEALIFFKESLENEYKANNFPENIAYKKAVIAYFENDINSLEENILLETRDNNQKILENMLKGLKERGYPNYKIDYRV